MSAAALMGVAVRWILFAAVLVTTGAAAFRFLVLRRLPEAAGLRTLAASAGALAALAGLLAAVTRLPLQLAELRDEAVPLLPQIQALGLHTMWGAVWLYQLAMLLGAMIAFVVARRGSRESWAMATVFSVLALASLPASGHAIGSERFTILAVVADTLHVLGAGTWIGAMLMLALGLSLAHRDQESGGKIAAEMVAAFSPMALTAAGLVLITGVFAAWLHLGTIPALWQSRYGQALLIKLGAVGVMAAAGGWNWKRSGPALRESGVIGPMRRAVRVEVVVGALVVLATAFLVAIPQPGTD